MKKENFRRLKLLTFFLIPITWIYLLMPDSAIAQPTTPKISQAQLKALITQIVEPWASESFQHPFCKDMSRVFVRILKKHGIEARVLSWPDFFNHYVIEVDSSEGPLILDTTYRQFFLNNEHVYPSFKYPKIPEPKMAHIFESLNMPKVLIAPKAEYFQRLNSFVLKLGDKRL